MRFSSKLPSRLSLFGEALVCVLFCFALTAPAFGQDKKDGKTIDGVEKEIATTSERLQQLHAEIEASRQLKEKLKKALAASNEQVGERKSRIAGLNNDLETYNTQLNKLDKKIVEAQSEVDERKRLLAESIRQAQRVTSASGLKVLLQSDNPADADRFGVYTQYFMQAQQKTIQQQQVSLLKIGEAREEALKNRNWVNHIKKKATAQHDTYKQNSSKKKQSIDEVQTEISHKTRTVAQLKKDQARLQTLMEELRAAQVAASGYFVAGRGNYGLPVNGTIKARFGETKSVGKIKWNGYFIEAKNGSPVRSIADGSVVYSDWLQGFGMLVILDHGDGYMTLYGGNRNVAVRQGDWADSGATIATVGDSGGQKTSGVYFEIRHNAKPIDPKGWVSAKNSVKSAKK